jgi:hypothetical protein
MEKTNRKIIRRRITQRRQAKEKRHKGKKTKCMRLQRNLCNNTLKVSIITLVPGKPNQIQQDSKFCHISGSNSKTQS